MKKVYALLSAIVLISLTLLMKTAINDPSNTLFDANVEALAEVESTIIIGCDNYSEVMICQTGCLCGRQYKAKGGHGHATGLKGKCACGLVW